MVNPQNCHRDKTSNIKPRSRLKETQRTVYSENSCWLLDLRLQVNLNLSHGHSLSPAFSVVSGGYPCWWCLGGTEDLGTCDCRSLHHPNLYCRASLTVLPCTCLMSVVLTRPLPVPARTLCAIKSGFQLGCKSLTWNCGLLHANDNTSSILKSQLLQEKSIVGFDSHGRSASDSFVLQDFVRPFRYNEEFY